MIRTTRDQDVTIIELGPSYRSLDEDALEEAGGLLLTLATTVEPPWVVLDMSGTDSFGSTFIEILVRTWKRLSERGGTFALCGLQPFCTEVLRVSRLDTLLDVYVDRHGAVAALASGTQDGLESPSV